MADNSQAAVQDAYGHFPQLTGPTLTAGTVGTTAVGTIAPTTNAGASATVTFGTGQRAVDHAGTFTLNANGTTAAGGQAAVTFAAGLPAVPTAILVTIYDQANGAAVAAAATNITCQGFTVSAGTALTTAHAYTVSYLVVT